MWMATLCLKKNNKNLCGRNPHVKPQQRQTQFIRLLCCSFQAWLWTVSKSSQAVCWRNEILIVSVIHFTFTVIFFFVVQVAEPFPANVFHMISCAVWLLCEIACTDQCAFLRVSQRTALLLKNFLFLISLEIDHIWEKCLNCTPQKRFSGGKREPVI